MPVQWEAEIFGAVALTPREVGVWAAERLNLRDEHGVELTTLYLLTLDAAVALEQPALLADHITWQRVRLRSLEAAVSDDLVRTTCWEALAGYVEPEDAEGVDELLRAALALAATAEATAIEPVLTPEAQRYLDDLVRGDRVAALTAIGRALSEGLGVREILLGVVQPAQLALGWLWEQGRITVAHEHRATAISELALAMLLPLIDRERSARGRAVSLCAGTEPHHLGLRIVTDLLEEAGWRTTYLGVCVPQSDTVDLISFLRADLLLVSATMGHHVPAAGRLIRAVRRDPRLERLRIVVGGRAFQLAPQLVRSVGADAWAADGSLVVEVCERLMAGDGALAAQQALIG